MVHSLQDAYSLTVTLSQAPAHTLTQQLYEQRFKALYDSLDPHSSKRIVDSAMEKHAGGTWLKAIPTVPELSISSDKMAVVALRGCSWEFHCRKRIDDFNVQYMLLFNIAQTKIALMQRHDDTIKHYVNDLYATAGLHVDVEASPFGERESYLIRKARGSPDLIIYNLGKRGSGPGCWHLNS